MKIRIIDNLASKDAISYSKTRKIVDILESSKYLDVEVTKFREKHNIPLEGYPLRTQEDFLFYSSKIGDLADQGLMKDCQRIAKKLNIPQFWNIFLVDVLLAGIFIPPDNEGFKVIATSRIGTVKDPFKGDSWAMGNEMIIDLFNQMIKERAVILAIRQKISKAELKKLIDQHWVEIESGMQHLPEVKLHQIKRVKLARQIAELRDLQNMKFNEIADHLAETKYQNDYEIHDLLTEDYVKNLYSRWKKKSKKVSSK